MFLNDWDPCHTHTYISVKRWCRTFGSCVTQGSSSSKRTSQRRTGQPASPTEWVNSVACVDKKNKNNDLQICMDPGDFNKNIKCEHYQIPTREEIASEMAGARCFSKLDAALHQWRIEVMKYCTFNTLYGRYRFLRMPFGIISASGGFHCAIDNMLEGFEGVRCYVDDVII